MDKFKEFLRINVSWIDAVLAGYFIFVTVVTRDVFQSWLDSSPLIESARSALVVFLYSPSFLMFLAIVKIVCMCHLGILSRDYSILKKNNADLEEFLSSLAPSLNLLYESVLEAICAKAVGRSNHRVRISLYVPDKNNENFTLLGRFSDDFELRQIGRISLPMREGCVGRAWKLGECEEPTLSLKDGTRTRRLEKEYNISPAVFANLRMKTLSIGAYRIMDPLNQPLGVLVIESVEHGQINFRDFKTVLTEEVPVLQRLITTTRQYVADPALAKEAGV